MYLQVNPHFVPPCGVVSTVVAPIGSFAQVYRGDVAFDFVFAPERQGAVVAGVRPFSQVHSVHMTTHLKKIIHSLKKIRQVATETIIHPIIKIKKKNLKTRQSATKHLPCLSA